MISAPIPGECSRSKASSMPRLPPGSPTISCHHRVTNIHSCNRSPAWPNGSSRLRPSPVPKPSSEMEKNWTRASDIARCSFLPRSCLSRLPPAELRRDEPEDALDRVGVVLDAELVRDRQEQRVGGLDRRVSRELADEDVGLRGVRPSEDRLRLRVDVPDLVRVLIAAPEVRAVSIVDQGED